MPYEALIFTGGDWCAEKCRALLAEYNGNTRPALILAADSGYKKALALPRTEGKLLRDCRTMTEEYLALYREKLCTK